MKIFRDQHGFTLIELMVVIGIIILMAGLAITNYISFAERSAVRAGREETHNFLSDIQNRARMGHRGTGTYCSVDPNNPGTALNNALLRWEVTLDDSTMTAQAFCTNGSSQQVIAYLPRHVQFQEQRTIFFPALYGNPSGNINILTDIPIIRVEHRNGAYSFCLQVTRGGSINNIDCP
ncbi:MAG: prepilin-type N-terminal cleavage/methylation domain-containing protein [Pseudomonadales bacterium]|nr:prepilin-type N-terminal cleavage/methylation domain-containing protein [Pseudomonadales bacterium]